MGETASAGVGTHLSPGDRHELTQRCGLRRAGSGNLIDSPDHYVANPESSRAARSETSPSTAVRSD